MIDKSIITIINLTYEGRERELHLMAFSKYPTLLNDCPLSRRRKENLRKLYIDRINQEA